MSVHPSLSGKSNDKQFRTVLTRLEKLKKLKEEGKWGEGNSAFGLPKVKTVRLKLKKEKVEKPGEAEAIAGAEGQAVEGKPVEKKAAEATKGKTDSKVK